MKRILFFMILTLGLVVSCKNSSEVTLPDSNLTVQNDVLLYKEKPYTGKIKMNLSDKIQGYEGFLNVKDGHLDGLNDIKNESKKQQMKFTIVNGKFDGDVIANDPEQSIKMELAINKGAITKMDADLQGTTKINLTFNKGLANGTMEAGGQKFTFKDGMGELSGRSDVHLKLTVDEGTGDMLMESLDASGKSLGQQKVPNQMTPKYMEQVLFAEILKVNG